MADDIAQGTLLAIIFRPGSVLRGSFPQLFRCGPGGAQTGTSLTPGVVAHETKVRGVA